VALTIQLLVLTESTLVAWYMNQDSACPRRGGEIVGLVLAVGKKGDPI